MSSESFLRRLRDDTGAQAVEFALIFIFALAPLILGMIEMGAGFYSQITITQAAREAARQLALDVGTGTPGTCDASCQSAVSTTAANYAQPLTLTSTTLTACAQGATQGSFATVKIQAKTLLPLLFTFTVTGSASMPCGG